MGVSLSKGGNVSLTKAAPGLTAVVVGLGWDVRTTTGTDYDLDASAIMVGEGGTDVFVGDTLFAPEVGTARCDFPGGDARVLFHSIQRLLALPDATRLHLCHDYPARGEAPRLASTVARQRALNIHVREGTDVETFVALRRARDATLAAPSLLFPALQVNLRAGQLPVAEANGVSYLRIPLNRF